MARFLTGFIAALVIIAIAGGAFYFGKKQVGQSGSVSSSPAATTVTSTLGESPSPQTETQSTSDFVNPSATITAIGDSVPAKKYSDLSAYMTSQVNLVLEASECCGDVPKADVIKQMSYLNSGTAPWNFADDNPIAAQIVKAVPQFKDYIIGTSANRYAVGFHLNDKYLVDKVYMVVDYKLITQ